MEIERKWMVNSLIQKGYLCKVQSPDDRREYHLEPTQKYFDYYNISYAYLSVVMDRIKVRFSEEDAEKIEQMLDVISEELMPEIQLPTQEKE